MSGLSQRGKIACAAAILAFIILVTSVWLALSAPEVYTTEEVTAQAEPSVASIKGRLSSGTGFVVGDGILATNRHVVETELMRHIVVHFPGAPDGLKGPHSVQLRYMDSEIDLALLSVSGEHPAALECAGDYSFRRGQDVIVIGNPGVKRDVVLENAVSRGVMSSETEIEGRRYDQLSISVNEGNSGGPVLDHSGMVIGMLSLKAADKEGLAFSIPVRSLLECLQRAESMSGAEVDRAESEHRLRALYAYVSSLGNIYKICMGLYIDTMNRAVEAGLSASKGLSLAREKVEQQVRTIDRELSGDLEDVMSEVASDTRLSESTRQRMVDFWSNYREMKSYVDEPRGNLISYRAKYHDLADTHDRLSESIRLLVGLRSTRDEDQTNR